MKIDNSSSPLNSTPLPGSPPAEGKPRAGASKSTDTPSSSTQSGTSVNIGSASAQLRNLESNVANAPMVNAAKVAEIKKAISEGRFQVNASAVADSLIRSVTDLISTQKA